MTEPRYEWNSQDDKLLRIPAVPVSSREETIRLSGLLDQISNGDALTRKKARYEMAVYSFSERHLLQPCSTIPGGFGPVFVRDTKPRDYGRIAGAIKKLAHSDQSARERHVESDLDCSDAKSFLEFVTRVATIENHNEANCKALLRVHSDFLDLNPGGDTAKIAELRRNLRDWYKIELPATKTREMAAQARAVTRQLRWLSSAWRNVWSSP